MFLARLVISQLLVAGDGQALVNAVSIPLNRLEITRVCLLHLDFYAVYAIGQKPGIGANCLLQRGMTGNNRSVQPHLTHRTNRKSLI